MEEEQDPVEEILNHWVRAIGQQVHYSYFAPPPRLLCRCMLIGVCHLCPSLEEFFCAVYSAYWIGWVARRTALNETAPGIFLLSQHLPLKLLGSPQARDWRDDFFSELT